MNRLFSLAAMSAVIAAPAFAEIYTIEFTPDEGEVIVATYDNDAMTVTVGDNTMPYVLKNERSLCVTLEGEEQCATFETPTTEVGSTSRYTATNGSAGVAKLIAYTE